MSHFIRHLSIRVPWHDTSWTGELCQNPSKNIYCTILKGIRENKSEDSCKCFDKDNGYPPCIKEKVSFMNPNPLTINNNYPYTYHQSAKHFQETEYTIPPFSASTIPYRWMLREKYKDIQDLIYEPLILNEQDADALKLTNQQTWWQTRDNQKKLFDMFYSFIQPKKSLSFFYTKNVPFIEETKGRRIIVGIGEISKVDSNQEYSYSETTKDMHRALMWERAIYHSIRPNTYENGILMPYHELYEYSLKDPGKFIAWEKCTVFSSVEAFDRFSYGTEHAFHEDGINILQQTKNAFKEISKHLKKDYSKAYNWIDVQLNNLWKLRGAYPSFGEVLVAFGIKEGYQIEKQIFSKNIHTDWWEYFEQHCKEFEISSQTKLQNWIKLSGDKKELYYTLSRISISTEQIKEIIDSENDSNIVKNPYLLYHNFNINIFNVDRAMYPNTYITKQFDKIKGTVFNDDIHDVRRVEALCAYILRLEKDNGHTVLPAKFIVDKINELPLEELEITIDDLDSMLDDRNEYLVKVPLSGNSLGIQLKHYSKVKNIIRGLVEKRINKGTPIDGEIQEDAQLDKEQNQALQLLYKNRFSVLTGSAGTGKTSVIKSFCKIPTIVNEKILCLAPTGKARTLLNKIPTVNTQTIAGFLMRNERYKDMEYYPKFEKNNGITAQTVIIDECSMLTEDMMAALFEVIHTAKRIILVGDDNQLPPIGAGKPFADIIQYLQSHARKEQHLLYLEKNYRQEHGASISFALNFSNHKNIEDDVTKSNSDLKFISYDSAENLEQQLFEVLENEFGIKDKNSYLLSIGGKQKGKFIDLFQNKLSPDVWQILSPSRQHNMFGIKILNTTLHKYFFQEDLDKQYHDKYKNRLHNTPTPSGEEKILHGAKVINLINRNKEPEFSTDKVFIANGEIGIVKGRLDKGKESKNDYYQVEYEGLDGLYRYTRSEFMSDEKDPPLELAYSLTVHKAQGSQFDKTLIIIPKYFSLLSREMLYTALTRHKEQLIILHEGDTQDILQYSSIQFSNLAKRMTNLFVDSPNLEYIEKFNSYFDMNRIHKTDTGEFVRSKSEVIIANLLSKYGCVYEYEKELIINKERKIPDFTITDSNTGITYLWEHLGMLDNEQYAKKWAQKLQWYNDNNIYEVGDENDSELQLLTSDEIGGFDSEKIEQLIEKYLA